MKVTRTYQTLISTASTGLLAATTACTAGEFTALGAYVVPVANAIQLGVGGGGGQDQALGRIYVDLRTAVPASVNGTFRIVVEDSNKNFVRNLWEGRTEATRLGATDPRLRQVFPSIPLIIVEYYRIRLFFNPDTTATITLANSFVEIAAIQGTLVRN